MSDDLVKQLSSYKAQLQQVEVALSTDPDNEDLLKLQKDLQVCPSVWIHILLLCLFCLWKQGKTSYFSLKATNLKVSIHGCLFFLQEVIDLTKDLLTSQPAEGASTTNGSVTVPVKHGWKVGDRCMATWSHDGQ